MTDPQDLDQDLDQKFEAVDRLVRSHLDRQAERLDLTRLQGKIRQDRARPRPANRWPKTLGWTLAAASILIGAFLTGRHLGPAEASASTLLHNLRVIHSHEVDRSYRVHYAPDPRYWDRSKVLEGPSESVLWTRGDRFWSDCSMGEIRLKIGREADGTLWISPSRQKGIRFPAQEANLPSDVAVLCEINSLTVPALVDDVLADFDLRAEGPASQADGSSSVVWARLKPGRSHPLIAAALLEIDSESEILTRLVLWTLRDGRPNGTVTYTFLESSEQKDDAYQLEYHLDPDAKIDIQSFKPD